MVSMKEALSLILRESRPLPAQETVFSEALGSVLAQDVVASDNIPSFDNSAMDGFAVRAADTAGAADGSPGSLQLRDSVAAGHVSGHRLLEGEAVKIMTGAPLPEGADAVIEVEATREEEGFVYVSKEIATGANVRPAGEDVTKGSTVLSPGSPLGPAEVGMLAGLGQSEVKVHRRPRVAVLATGSELVGVDEELTPGKIRDSNSYTAAAQCRALGLDPVRLGVAPDDRSSTKRLMEEGLEYDVLITSGGVSVGEYDFVKEVQDELGVERKFWGVAIKPGKPLSFGVREGTLVFGVPGNPVAAMVSFELFIRPALLKLMGHQRVLRSVRKAVLREDARNRHGRVHVMRVRAWREGGRWIVSNTGPQGSGILRSMVLANGLVLVPEETGGLHAGDEVDLILLREEGEEPEE